MPTYLGASLELGNARDVTGDISWNTTLAAGSLFLRVVTFLGPVNTSYGYTEGSNHAGFCSWVTRSDQATVQRRTT